MSSDLLPLYPTGDHLEGNFVQDYLSHYNYYDRYLLKLFGEKGIEVDKDEAIEDTIEAWDFDVDSIVFSHLNDWAKMYSALIKDYEPLWNVDGEVETTYGETHKEDTKANRRSQDIMGAKHTDNIYGAQHKEDKTPQYTDNVRNYHTTYPDATERVTDREETAYAAHTNEHDERTYTDQVDERTYTDTHTTDGYKDEYDEDEHTVTERRTGNIGVTKSTELVESEARLRTTWNFYKTIFSYIINEIGAHYYD